jgi:hypothetical protein
VAPAASGRLSKGQAWSRRPAIEESLRLEPAAAVVPSRTVASVAPVADGRAQLLGPGADLALDRESGRSQDDCAFALRGGCCTNPPAAGCIASKGGLQNGHLVRRERTVCREGVRHGGSGVHFRERAARFPRRLYATATGGRSHERGRRPHRNPSNARNSVEFARRIMLTTARPLRLLRARSSSSHA